MVFREKQAQSYKFETRTHAQATHARCPPLPPPDGHLSRSSSPPPAGGLRPAPCLARPRAPHPLYRSFPLPAAALPARSKHPPLPLLATKDPSRSHAARAAASRLDPPKPSAAVPSNRSRRIRQSSPHSASHRSLQSPSGSEPPVIPVVAGIPSPPFLPLSAYPSSPPICLAPPAQAWRV